MKGTNYNGGYFASKGTCRSEGEAMFSIGNLVAFSYSYYSSPDGNDGRRGTNLLGADYSLQKEILLEEFDNTESNRFGSGNYDRKEVVEISDVWKHKESSWQRFGGYHRNFLCAVLNTQEPQIVEPFVKGQRIEEVRENPGHWLHVYEIDDTDFDLAGKAASFEEAIQKIKSESPKNKAAYGLANWANGEEFPVWYRKQDYYAPRAGVGGDGTPTGGDWATSVSAGWLRIMPCVPAGQYAVLIFGWAGYISVPDRKTEEVPYISLSVNTHWANSQSYKEQPLTETNIQKSWFFFNGEDMYEATLAEAQKNRTEQVVARNTKFAEAKAKALEAGIAENQIGQIIKLAGKGKVIVMIYLAARMVAEQKHNMDFVLRVFADLQGKNSAVIENYSHLIAHAKEIKLSLAKKAVERAGAWSYLRSLIPGYGTGYFDDAMEALKLALTNKVPFKNGNTETFGGENSESDLAIKLREAGLAK